MASAARPSTSGMVVISRQVETSIVSRTTRADRTTILDLFLSRWWSASWPCALRPATVPAAWPTTSAKKVSASVYTESTVCCSELAWSRSAALGRARSLRATPWLSRDDESRSMSSTCLRWLSETDQNPFSNTCTPPSMIVPACRSCGSPQSSPPHASAHFLSRVLRSFPFPIQEVQTDHGTEFTYIFMPHVQVAHPFEAALRQRSINHKLIPVATPKQNGKVERVHRTIDEECLNPRAFRKPTPRERAIYRWCRFYNRQRPHSSLEWRTPLQRLQSFPEYLSVTHV